MNFRNLLSLTGLLLAAMFMAFPAIAQDQPKKAKDKEVVIIKKAKGEDGKVKIKKKMRSGDAADELEMHEEGDHVIIKKIDGKDGQVEVIVSPQGMDSDTEHNVNVQVEETDGKKHIRVRIRPEGEEEQLIEWEGEGEMPAELRQQLEEKGIMIHKLEGEGNNFFKFEEGEGPHNFQWVEAQATPKAFLGVMGAEERTFKVIKDGEEEMQVEENTPPEQATDGARVSEIVAGSAAEAAGLQADDVLTAINDRSLSSFGDLTDFIQSAEIGQEVTIRYRRDGQDRQTTAVLTERPEGMKGHVIIDKQLESADEGGAVYKFRIKGDDIKSEKQRRVFIIKNITTDEGSATEEQDRETRPENLPAVPAQNTLQLENYQLFPNPTDGNLRLKFQAEASPVVISITDLNGKQLYRERIGRFDGNYDQHIDLSDMPNGALLLSIEQKGKVYIEQLLLQ